MEQTSEKKNVVGLNIDSVLENTGPCGTYQLYLQLFLSLLVLAIAYHGTLVHFTNENVSWMCKHDKHNTFCRNNFNNTLTKPYHKFAKLNSTKSTTHTNYSFVSISNLDGENSSKAVVWNSIFHFGGVIGVLISGISSDFYGRKKISMISLLFVIISSIECSFIKNVWQLMLAQGSLGAAQTSALLSTFVLILEFIPPSHRAISVGFFRLAFNVSQVILAALAYKRTNWQNTQYYASYSAIIPLLIVFFLSESPRWLWCTKQRKKASRVLKMVSKFNQNNEHSIRLKNLDTSRSYHASSWNIFARLHVLLITLAQIVLWFSIAMLQYYVLNIISQNVYGNMYKAFGLSTLATIPGCFASIGTCTRYGRKKSLLASLVITGLALFFHASLKGCSETVLITLTMVATFFVSVAYTSIWLWSFELFPTVLRSRGMSLCVAFERLGSLSVPLLLTTFRPDQCSRIHTIISITAVISVLVSLFLPETLDDVTRETQDDFFNKQDGYQVIAP